MSYAGVESESSYQFRRNREITASSERWHAKMDYDAFERAAARAEGKGTGYVGRHRSLQPRNIFDPDYHTWSWWRAPKHSSEPFEQPEWRREK